jgi:hypothetical protein
MTPTRDEAVRDEAVGDDADGGAHRPDGGEGMTWRRDGTVRGLAVVRHDPAEA